MDGPSYYGHLHCGSCYLTTSGKERPIHIMFEANEGLYLYLTYIVVVKCVYGGGGGGGGGVLVLNREHY